MVCATKESVNWGLFNMKSSLLAAVAVSAITSAAWAQEAPPTAEAPAPAAVQAPAAPAEAAPAPSQAAAQAPAAVVVPAGTYVLVATSEPLNSLTATTGAKVNMTLVKPLKAGETEVIPAGATVVGEIIHATPKANGGKPGEILVTARYIDVNGAKIPLKGLRLRAGGKDLSSASLWAMGLVKGSEAEMVAGTAGEARLSENLVVAAEGLRSEPVDPVTLAADAGPQPDVVPGKVKAPLPGKARVVFFRDNVFQGSAISYKIRTGPNNEVVLGTLSSGVYFSVDADPGDHLFTAATEARDGLKIEVEAGETYFVRGTVVVGAWVGQPNLAPSDKATFEAMTLKPAKKTK